MMSRTRVLTVVFCAVFAMTSLGQPLEWPRNLKEGKARIVRLKYAAGDWDHNMGKGGDYNLLLWYQVLTGLDIALQSEALSAADLRRTDDAELPPLLIITGMGNVAFTDEEVAILRWFCLEKRGMLVADNGGGHFDREIRQVLQRIFPDAALADIPNDAPMYLQPFRLPDGAPPLWHHSGKRAQGIKDGARWVTFYHQGDLLDAWRDSHSGVPESLAIAAYKMGLNLMYYAYSQRESKVQTSERIGAGDAPTSRP